MSFGARTDSTVIDDAIKAAYEVGILTVAAAGNDDAEISDTTPARIPEVFTVGYTNEQRRRVTNADGFQGSNYGPQLDIWAPGFQIVSADYLSDTGNRTESGTSMAAPLVSGMVCYLRALTGALGAPDEVTGRILELGDKGVVTGVQDSANVLLYNGNGA
jgi:oryzin